MNCWLVFALLRQNFSLPHKLAAEGHFNMIFLVFIILWLCAVKDSNLLWEEECSPVQLLETKHTPHPHQESVIVRFIHHLKIVLADGVALSCFVQNT